MTNVLQTANAICKMQIEFGKAEVRKPNEIKGGTFGTAHAYIIIKHQRKDKTMKSNFLSKRFARLSYTKNIGRLDKYNWIRLAFERAIIGHAGASEYKVY